MWDKGEKGKAARYGKAKEMKGYARAGVYGERRGLGECVGAAPVALSSAASSSLSEKSSDSPRGRAVAIVRFAVVSFFCSFNFAGLFCPSNSLCRLVLSPSPPVLFCAA